MMQNNILAIDSLKIGYRSGKRENVLLSPLTANARKGELIAVIGKNGIGKSTLLKTIAGLQPSLGGTISFAGKNISQYSRMELAMEVGYISTEAVKVSNMRVYDLVALGRFPHTNWIGLIDSMNHDIIMNSIEMTGMLALRNRFVAELSDGERQRAMIARIFAQDTDIMVMDEPTAFLDIGGKFEILHLMHNLSQKNNKAIIYSTHDLQMALSQSDKIWLLLDDKLIEGAPEDLMIIGAFDHIFDSSPVQFNSEQGIFTFKNVSRGSIKLTGEGKFRHWTGKAIIRAGFVLSDHNTSKEVIIPFDNKGIWQYLSNGNKFEFESIYELINYLRIEDTTAI